ncbi:MAG TPA: hypothetical protein VN656_10735, partial [Stellaceae bacterium]|nr:hypothetical protein [Stellaceae bacterium]
MNDNAVTVRAIGGTHHPATGVAREMLDKFEVGMMTRFVTLRLARLGHDAQYDLIRGGFGPTEIESNRTAFRHGFRELESG